LSEETSGMIAAKSGTGPIAWTPEEIAAHERQDRPWFTAMAHVSLPVRDLEEAKRFYTEVLGGRLILNLPEFAEVMLAGTIVGFSAHQGQPQSPGTEFPHVAFSIESAQFAPMKRWLEDHGVPTHDLWTRNGREGLMYFKDPSGNLFEIYCSRFDGANELQRGGARGGESVVDLASLNYEEWNR
jgi:catechol 2,3-dioxygenase-like lactoylglutathione lyase family enzyme